MDLAQSRSQSLFFVLVMNARSIFEEHIAQQSEAKSGPYSLQTFALSCTIPEFILKLAQVEKLIIQAPPSAKLHPALRRFSFYFPFPSKLMGDLFGYPTTDEPGRYLFLV